MIGEVYSDCKLAAAASCWGGEGGGFTIGFL